MEEKVSIEALLREGKTVQFHPTGWSMFPLFSGPEDYAVVEPKTEPVKKMDVVVYRRPNGPLIIHRVIKVTPEGYYIVGDNQSIIEGPVAEDCILGRMIFFIRKGHTYSVRNPIYRFLSIIWRILRPVRMPAMSILRKIKHIFIKRK